MTSSITRKCSRRGRASAPRWWLQAYEGSNNADEAQRLIESALTAAARTTCRGMGFPLIHDGLLPPLAFLHPFWWNNHPQKRPVMMFVTRAGVFRHCRHDLCMKYTR